VIQKKADEGPCVNKRKPEADELPICSEKYLEQMKPCLVTQHVITKVDNVEHSSYNKNN